MHPSARVEPEARARREADLVEAAKALGIRGVAERLQLVAPLVACEAPAARLVQRPRLVTWLSRTKWLDEERPAISFERELAARTRHLTEAGDLDRVLRLYRQREMLRIALRDLTRRAQVRVITREISHLADALIGAATAFHDRVLAKKHGAPLGNAFCVIAMGKHGAREVNYSSDVDVLFLASDEPGVRDRAIPLARNVIRSMSLVTEHGFAFRVDANLRPYGRDGPLVNTPEELERYYERAGQTWERAALIKARPCAGGRAMGDELVERLRPFVYRRNLDLEAVEALAQMKRRIDRARELSPVDDVKLGTGGIREVEFHVQALQLLHGGRHPRLRVRGTLEALEALLYAGFVSAQDRDALAEAYVFLRDVEHRVQLPQDQQTHRLPERGSAAREALAGRMGFEDPEAFEAELARHRLAVQTRFSSLLATAEERPRHPPEVDLALAPDEADSVRESALSALGFADPEIARTEISRLARQTDGAFGPRGREKHRGLAERLLDEMARSPAPDQALARFAHLATPLWDPAALSTLLAANAATARLLVLLFATSEALTRDFQLHPELLDALVRSDAAVLEKSRDELAREVSERLEKQADLESKLALLRRVRHEETLRIGLHDLAGRLGAATVGRQLTIVAEVLLSEAFSLARAEVAERFGEPPVASLCVLGLGSFGGAELDYESDLDLVFVHESSGITSGGSRGSVDAGEWAARVFQRLLSHLTLPTTEGVLYRVDSRLRPSGSAGPLVASLGAFGAYHRGETPQGRGAALWERQALLRARVVAGEALLGQWVTRDVLDAVVGKPLPADAAAQIADMRRRLDVVKPGVIEPKKGPGGLLDVEFAAQWLLLKHGLRVASTRGALTAIGAVSAVPAEDVQALATAWELLRRVESRLRLVYGRADVFVPTSGPGLARIARQLGDAAPDAGSRLVRDLERTMRATRELFTRIVG